MYLFCYTPERLGGYAKQFVNNLPLACYGRVFFLPYGYPMQIIGTLSSWESNIKEDVDQGDEFIFLREVRILQMARHICCLIQHYTSLFQNGILNNLRFGASILRQCKFCIIIVLQRTAGKYKKFLNANAKLLLCSLDLFFCHILGAVVVDLLKVSYHR